MLILLVKKNIILEYQNLIDNKIFKYCYLNVFYRKC